ncbi:MAG TPA: response regulator [Verrucomicrobiae bacterium]|nr:response regulator [Verrucomicrobiae bacterium]
MNRKRILMVDDEKGVTTMTKLNLERTGLYEVQVENRSTHALEAAKQFHPDMIILDITMPGLDGSEVASQIKADDQLKNTPIVFLTAVVSQIETGNSELRRGGQVFLSKPVNMKTLVSCIEQYTVK